ncbi:UDP-4-amino-4,6-dideoxy-N-acetyl-beta-L-altrosamine N-acetyltransferase [Paenibacillus sp. FSL H8-0034]|uniref:UDP-4-amino-4, 6-dideoxy-N-acetyl-beta-L-altrosamine N-acetyltransferase n=1 Tax=Paenibacillus sp. FSL H8-0034 TaxID=2954671 RepID=UPI0030FB2F31
MVHLEKCALIDLDETHLPLLLQWRNSERVRSFMFRDHIITWEEHKAWYQKYQSGRQTVCKTFLVNDKPLGFVSVYDIDRYNGICKWSIYIGDDAAPRGSGTAMGYLALNVVFDELKVRRCCSEIFAFNKVSIRYHQKLGFHEEGKLVMHIKKQDRYEDIVLMALFDEKWSEMKQGIAHAFPKEH